MRPIGDQELALLRDLSGHGTATVAGAAVAEAEVLCKLADKSDADSPVGDH